MKLLLIALLATFSIAGTTYVAPTFTVENKTLYCYCHKRDIIKEHVPGDLVSGDYASKYCSYNKQTVEQIKQEIQKKYDEQTYNFEILFGIIVFIAFISLFFT